MAVECWGALGFVFTEKCVLSEWTRNGMNQPHEISSRNGLSARGIRFSIPSNPLAHVCLCIASHPPRACLSVEWWLLILRFGRRFIQIWWMCHTQHHTFRSSANVMRANVYTYALKTKVYVPCGFECVCTSVSTFHFYSPNFWAVRREPSTKKRHIRTTQAPQLRTNK